MALKSGIGKQLTVALVGRGWKVTVIDRGHQCGRREQLSRELGDSVHYTVCDVTQYDHLTEVFTTTRERWGSIDCFCSNAGVFDRDSVFAFDYQDKEQ